MTFLEVEPVLFTSEETVRYLRLDVGRDDLNGAFRALDGLVQKGLRPCMIGRERRWAKGELDRFISEITNSYQPRTGPRSTKAEPKVPDRVRKRLAGKSANDNKQPAEGAEE
jgi:hypothetical protein